MDAKSLIRKGFFGLLEWTGILFCAFSVAMIIAWAALATMFNKMGNWAYYSRTGESSTPIDFLRMPLVSLFEVTFRRAKPKKDSVEKTDGSADMAEEEPEVPEYSDNGYDREEK